MKKYALLLFIMILTIILSVGCSSLNTAHWEEGIYETVNNLEGVRMLVKENSLSSKGLTLIIKNDSDRDCIFSEDFLLEKNRWKMAENYTHYCLAAKFNI